MHNVRLARGWVGGKVGVGMCGYRVGVIEGWVVGEEGR